MIYETPGTTGIGPDNGNGAGDHDQPYLFGRRPRAIAPFPFSTRQYGRLLILRGRVQDNLVGRDDRTRPGAILARWVDDGSPHKYVPMVCGDCSGPHI